MSSFDFIEESPEGYNIKLMDKISLPSVSNDMHHSVYLIHGDYPHFRHISVGIYDAVTKIKETIDRLGESCNYDALYFSTLTVVEQLQEDLSPPCVNAHIMTSGQVQLYFASLYPPYAFGMPGKFRGAIIDELRDLLDMADEIGTNYAGFGALTCTHKRIQTIAKDANMPVNDGNILTAVGILQSLKNAFEYKGLDLQNSTIAIVGATGSVGTSLCRLLMGAKGKFLLCGRSNQRKLQAIGEVLSDNDTDVEIYLGEAQSCQAMKQADAVVILTGDVNLKFDQEDFSPDVQIICDATRPRSTEIDLPNKLPNALVYDGPTMLIDGIVIYPEIFGLESNEILCCMGQNSLLAEAGMKKSFAVYPLIFSTKEQVKEFFLGELTNDIITMIRIFNNSGSRFADYFRWHEWILYPRHERKCSRTVAISGFTPKF